MKFRLLYILLVTAFPLFSQVYSFKSFSEDDGLSQSFINGISQDKKGIMYIATGNGLTCYDGTKFTIIDTSSGIANNFITSLFLDRENKAWLGDYEGGVSIIYPNGGIRKIKFKEEMRTKIIQIVELSAHNYLFLKNNSGLILYNEETGSYLDLEEEVFKEVLNIRVVNNNLLLVKADGLYSLKVADFISKNYRPEKRLSLKEGALIKPDGSNQNLILADNVLGILVLSNDGKFTPKDTFKLARNDGSVFTRIVADRGSEVYVSTTDNGIFKFDLDSRKVTNYTTRNGLSSNAVQSIFIDRENNLWIGTYGNGLQVLHDELYSYNLISDLGQKLTINGALKLSGKLVLASNKGIGYFDNEKIDFVKHPFLEGKNINGLIRYKDDLIFSASNGELFKSDTLFKKISKVPIVTSYQKLVINSLSHDENHIYACATSGLYIIDPVKYSYTILNTESGLLHNNVKFVYRDSKERLWICSPGTPVYYLDSKNEVIKFNEIPGLKNFNTNGICEDPDQNIWISSVGDGVFKYNGKTFENFTTANGLKSNFCYGITCDYKKGVWVTHSNGISYKNNNKKNFDKVNGRSELIPAFFIENSLYYDKHNNEVVFGTTDGIIRINTTKQKFNDVEPALNITQFCLNDSCVQSIRDTSLNYDNYNLSIDFVAVCLKDPTRVKYKYKLEGLMDDWEFITYETRRLNFPKLKDGEYTFLIYACNNDGLWNSEPVKLKITIHKPFWKKAWFIIVLFIGIVLLFIYLVKRRTAELIRKQEKLEGIIAEKTEEIKEEKEIIAKINEDLNVVLKDLQDSINYAKKIQARILPDLAHAQKSLRTFLYFQPKDVVSGDYYGFYNVTKHQTIVYLIDCTGHGVPGAFLTVISKAFLNKIIIDKEIYEPDAIIENLNFELRNFFDTRDLKEEEKNYEGLVISICLIDYPNKMVEFCGAGRPILYKIEDKLFHQRGDINSVGYDEDLPDLEVIRIPFDKGLRVYLHSDGIQDQFGGPNRKKFSSRRIVEILEKSENIPFEKECQDVIDAFKTWKGEEAQVDDVCFFAFELFSGV
jgi:ligand-binding sensor domain-containing protein